MSNISLDEQGLQGIPRGELGSRMKCENPKKSTLISKLLPSQLLTTAYLVSNL